MALLFSRPTTQQVFPGPQEREDLIAAEDFSEGLITDIEASRIPDNALSVATNVHYAKKMPGRRNGLTAYSITKPNSQRVIKIFAFYHNNTGINIIRFTRNTVHRAGSAGWTAFTPTAIAAFSGTDYDPFSCAVGDNRCFVANNGVDPIREIRPGSADYVALGNADRYKYVSTGFNRVLATNLAAITDKPYQVGWSGDQNYGVWDTATDPSAGLTNLIDSPSDINDDITGNLTWGNFWVIPRIRSFWLGVSQPSATAPFAFFAALPDTGADIPRCIHLTPFGICFVNYLESAVYIWRPTGDRNDKAQNISTPKVSRGIKRDITDPNYVWASYSRGNKRYSIFIASATSSTTIEWSYDFEYNIWTRSTYGNNLTCVDDLSFASSSVTIDELTGTIDALVGTIKSLAGLSSVSTRFLGYNNGDINYQPDFYNDSADASKIVSTDAGTAFTTTIAFKILESPIDYLFMNFVRVNIIPYSVGTVNLQYSKDDGQTWTTIKSVTYVAADLNKVNFLQIRKAVKSKRIIWQITTSDCMCACNGFYVKNLKGGLAK